MTESAEQNASLVDSFTGFTPAPSLPFKQEESYLSCVHCPNRSLVGRCRVIGKIVGDYDTCHAATPSENSLYYSTTPTSE